MFSLLQRCLIALLNVTFGISITYNVDNAIEVFQYFKEKYNKIYKNASDERLGLQNFVSNLNKVAYLNELTEDRNTFYIINQYADLDPKELSEHYAINIKPYFKVTNKNDAEYAGRARNKEIKKSALYDLDEAEELYKDYMKKYNKKNATKTFDRQVKYYRFIKTLVELNNKYLNGDSDVELDDKADVLKEPNEYFWPNY